MSNQSIFETALTTIYSIQTYLSTNLTLFITLNALNTTPYHLIPYTLFTKYYVRLADYFSKIEVNDDSKNAIKAGVVIGLGVVGALSLWPGTPFDYSKLDGGNGDGDDDVTESEVGKEVEEKKVLDENGKDGSKEEEAFDWDADKVMLKTKKWQKMFKLTDAEMKLAISNAHAESKGQKIQQNLVSSRNGRNGDGDSLSLSTKVDIIVYTFLISGLLYCVYTEYGVAGGNFSRLVMRYFPREGKALGILDGSEMVYRL